MRDLREREARAALTILGVTSEPCFLRVADGTSASLAADAADAIVAAIVAAIGEAARPLVMGPWIRDHHTDHLAVAALVRRACARRPAAALLEYAVWLDERGSDQDQPRLDEAMPVVLDIREHRPAKAAALAAHRSQLGGLITDATTSFVLPPGLVASVDRQNERFLSVRPPAQG